VVMRLLGMGQYFLILVFVLNISLPDLDNQNDDR
jgi:hypothetical protein